MLMIRRHEIELLLDMQSCIDAVEHAFRARGEGDPASSGVIGLELSDGSLHAKLGALTLSRPYAVAKVNANFPGNPVRYGLPTIQGVLLLFDASSGKPLACMDSGLITAMRTAATTAVAAQYLALPRASSIAFIGCGIQARAHLDALFLVRGIKRLTAFDLNGTTADQFADYARERFQIVAEVAGDVGRAAIGSEIIVTSTPSRQPFLKSGDVAAGTFVAAVGADNEHKNEISADLLEQAVVVVDDLDQCSRMGDLHHALAQGVIQQSHVRCALDQIVAGLAPGRLSDDEIIVFDSTGVAIEDVAAAAVVYERAENTGAGFVVALSQQTV
jgi:ornithine cyclodeaminase/alanine dehydrogenase-like protein (mu-crystallin family)